MTQRELGTADSNQNSLDSSLSVSVISSPTLTYRIPASVIRLSLDMCPLFSYQLSTQRTTRMSVGSLSDEEPAVDVSPIINKVASIVFLGRSAGLSTALHFVEAGYTSIVAFERDEKIPSQHSVAANLKKVVRAEDEDSFYTDSVLLIS
ncbi:hypothetical protein BKA56DRAFT_612802 [Ilyonectria sp. MPI-CAGE-AT-0026]|nr:hypothetical protein BKA56DRAFT_612802 [Ilyonectria sp. MPI-CAGE-AT-0026]